jgi:hypothetical protein
MAYRMLAVKVWTLLWFFSPFRLHLFITAKRELCSWTEHSNSWQHDLGEKGKICAGLERLCFCVFRSLLWKFRDKKNIYLLAFTTKDDSAIFEGIVGEIRREAEQLGKK